MKKIILILFIVLLSIETVLASENIYLNVNIPKEIEVGKNFTIDVYVHLNRSISGFECNIDIPLYAIKYIQFSNVTENQEIKEKAGEFYQLNLKNNSVSISFVLFDEPLNSNFHLITVKGKALKKGDLTIRITAIASDENGRAIKLSPVTYNLKIVGDDKDKNERTDGGKGDNIFSWIINAILNFLKMIFGG